MPTTSSMTSSEPRQWIGTSEGARLLGISEQTLRRCAQTKFGIRVIVRPGSNQRRYCLADVLRRLELLRAAEAEQN